MEEREKEKEWFRMREEMLANFTVRSIAQCMRERGDVYGGYFGRVAVRTTDL